MAALPLPGWWISNGEAKLLPALSMCACTLGSSSSAAPRGMRSEFCCTSLSHAAQSLVKLIRCGTAADAASHMRPSSVACCSKMAAFKQYCAQRGDPLTQSAHK